MPRGVYIRTDEHRARISAGKRGRPGAVTNLRHGHTSSKGGVIVVSRTWKSWESMKQRCLNANAPNYSRYGGRGICICEHWLVFENFLADMGERPPDTSLDRINNDGNYEPSNCRWADNSTQGKNTSNGLRGKHPNSINNLTAVGTSQSARKAWETRRSRYGQSGHG